MDFLSLAFAVFFIISVICYYAVPKKLRWGVLLLSSVIFYVWSVPYLIGYLLFSAVTSYIYGKWVEKHKEHGNIVLALVILANLAVLLTVKFAPLAGISILAPMGISFYTLQVIATAWTCIKEKQRRKVISLNIYCLYPSFHRFCKDRFQDTIS